MNNKELKENDLKKIAKVFDLNLITTFTMNKALKNTKIFSKCTNLQILSLRNCNLTYLNFPKTLKNLIFIDLRENQIIELDGITNLKNLITIRLEGNFISDLDELKYLKSLLDLKYLSFQTFDKKLNNPICFLKNYKKSIIKNSSNIQNLDYENIYLELKDNVLNINLLIKDTFTNLNNNLKGKIQNNIINLEKIQKENASNFLNVNKNSTDLQRLNTKIHLSEKLINELSDDMDNCLKKIY